MLNNLVLLAIVALGGRAYDQASAQRGAMFPFDSIKTFRCDSTESEGRRTAVPCGHHTPAHRTWHPTPGHL